MKQNENIKGMGIEYGDTREANMYVPSIKEPESESSNSVEKGSLLWALGRLKEGKKLVGHMTTIYTAWMNEDGYIMINDTRKYTEEEWLKEVPSAIAWEIEEEES